MVLTALVLQGATCKHLDQNASQDNHTNDPLRILLEDFVFIKGETDIIKGIIDEDSESFTLAGVATSKKDQGLSQNIDWDYLITNRAGAKKVFKNIHLRRGQIVSVTPGMDGITQKNALIKSLWSAYGEDMSEIMPLSFALPEGLEMLRNYISNAKEDQLEEVWVLKENKHRGQGVTPVLLKDILPSIMANYVTSSKQKNNAKKTGKYVLAQKFIANQMLIDDLPFTFRIWTIFGGGLNTSRGYLFDGSIVPFGDKPFIPDRSKPALSQANELIVNLFLQDRSKAKDPWSMQQLKDYMFTTTGSHQAFEHIWDNVRESIAKTLAAGIPNVRKEVQNLKYYQEGNFEVLGVDFIVDSNKKPWLIEVNYLPSMARKVVGCIKGISCSESIFDSQKEKFLNGLLHILKDKHSYLKAHTSEATRALEKKRSCSLPPAINADSLGQILDMLLEDDAALQNGFSSLNVNIYDSLIQKSRGKNVGKIWDMLQVFQNMLRHITPGLPIVKMDTKQLGDIQLDAVVHEVLQMSFLDRSDRAEQILDRLCSDKGEL